MIHNMPPRCPSCLLGTSLCASPKKFSFDAGADLSLDASALEFDHEHSSNPSAVSCLCNHRMGIGIGFDRGKRQPYPTPPIYVLRLPPPVALSRLLPHCCLPFLLGICRQVGCTSHHHGLTTIAEAALYPGAIYYLSRWYTRKEVGFRIALYEPNRLGLFPWTYILVG